MRGRPRSLVYLSIGLGLAICLLCGGVPTQCHRCVLYLWLRFISLVKNTLTGAANKILFLTPASSLITGHVCQGCVTLGGGALVLFTVYIIILQLAVNAFGSVGIGRSGYWRVYYRCLGLLWFGLGVRVVVCY